MIMLNKRLWSVDLPYTLRFHGVSEEMFNELVDEDTKAELFDGVMIVHSPASPKHDFVAGFLRALMLYFADESNTGLVLGPDTLTRLASERKFAPDIFFLAAERVPQPLPAEEITGAPDLVVEILSPSKRAYDLDEKGLAYHEASIREIWFVDPDQQKVIVDRQGKKGYVTRSMRRGRLVSKVLKGFWVDVEWLWAEPLPRVMPCLRKILKSRR